MVDPLSIAASVSGLISLALQVTQGLHDYYRAYQGQDGTISHLCGRLESLSTTLNAVDGALKAAQYREQNLVQQIERTIEACHDIIDELSEELDKVRPSAEPASVRDRVKNAGRRLAYPFRESTLHKIEEDVGELRDNLSFALSALQLEEAQHTRDELGNVTSILEQIRQHQVNDDIRTWLQAPDVTVNHIDACNKRHASTGLWLIDSKPYTDWIAGGDWLWIRGFAGCGKSVLCSTAINYAVREIRHHKASGLKVAVCFFYFTFSDTSKQDLLSMLRAIIMQVSSQASETHAELEAVRKANPGASHSPAALMRVFRSLISRFHRVYLLIDAVDESPAEDKRGPVLEALLEMHKWATPSLQILLTSRDERDIRDVLSPFWTQMPMENGAVDKDISSFVHEHLKIDLGLRKWHRHHQRIEEALTDGAKGVFRWVVCQFKDLGRCPVSKGALEKHLSSLPRSLDQTYERMLANIPADFRSEARRILTLLSLADRPLFATEILDYLAVQTDNPSLPSFDPDQRFDDENDILQICPGFLSISEDFQNLRPARAIRIAHFSVQEYLVSDRCRASREVSSFYIDAGKDHAHISKVLLTYILSEPLRDGVDQDNVDDLAASDNSSSDVGSPYKGSFSEAERSKDATCEEFPLAEYACQQWHVHYKSAQSHDGANIDLAFNLFTASPRGLSTYLHLAKVEEEKRHWRKAPQTPVSALYLASHFGLREVLLLILDRSKTATDPQAQLMSHCEASAFALVEENDPELDKCNSGRDIEYQDLGLMFERWDCSGKAGNALHAATNARNYDMVELLLGRGMNVNIVGDAVGQDGELVKGPALLTAVLTLDLKMAKLLLAYGADVKDVLTTLPDRIDHMPSPQAVVDFLHDLSIDPLAGTIVAGHSLLYVAIEACEVNIVRAVTDSHLDITQHKDRYYACPLWLAFREREPGQSPSRRPGNVSQLDSIIDLLLERLAKIPGRTSCCRNNFPLATSTGRQDLVRIMAERLHADYGLQTSTKMLNSAAIEELDGNDIDMLNVLLESGANARHLMHKMLSRVRPNWHDNKTEVEDDTRTSSSEDVIGRESRDDVLELLLQCDAALTPDEELVVSAYRGQLDVVRRMLTQQHCGSYDLALAWAIKLGHDTVSHELLSLRAEIPTWALDYACAGQNEDLVRAMLSRGFVWGADSAFIVEHVSRHGSTAILDLLLQSGASPEAMPIREWRRHASDTSDDGESVTNAEGVDEAEDQPDGREEVPSSTHSSLLDASQSGEADDPGKESADSSEIRSSHFQIAPGDDDVDSTTSQAWYELLDVKHTYARSSPLMEAVWGRKVDNVRLLLSHGAKVDGMSDDTPLLTASYIGHVKTVKALLDCGADPNAQRNSGATPLLQALRGQGSETEELVKALCDAGASVRAGTHRTQWGAPLESAVKLQDVAIIEYLIGKGAQVDEFAIGATRGDRNLLTLLYHHKRLQEAPGQAQAV